MKHIVLLAVLAFVSCTDSSEEKLEQYRFYLGAADTNFIITSMHLNAAMRKRIEDGKFDSHDLGILQENLVALRLNKVDFEASLKHLYSNDRFLNRDAAMLPMWDISMAATEALMSYSKTKDGDVLAIYYKRTQELATLIESLRSNSGATNGAPDPTMSNKSP